MSFYVIFHNSVFVMNLIHAISDMITGHFNTSSWKLMFNISSPFDRTVPFGWIVRWFIDISMGLSYQLHHFSSLVAFISMPCVTILKFLITSAGKLVNDIKHFVESPEIFHNQRTSQCYEGSDWKVNQIRTRVSQALTEVIKFHVSIFEWVLRIYERKNLHFILFCVFFRNISVIIINIEWKQIFYAICNLFFELPIC